MERQNMKNNTQPQAKRSIFTRKPALGQVRAGMHQKSGMEYLRSMMTAGTAEPELESVEEALEIPEVIEEMIPPEVEEEQQIVEIAADEDALAYVESSETEDDEETPVSVSLSVDYSSETVTPLAPVTGGVDCEPYAVIYDSGDGSVRMIPDPLGVLTDEGLHPFFPELENPSANIAAME